MGAGPIPQTAPTPTSVKQLGIIAALPEEARCLAKRPDYHHALLSPQPLSERVFLYISGIGPGQAAKAATTLIKHGADALLSWGCAGALSADVQTGDLLLPKNIQPEASDALPTDRAWHTHLSGLLANICKPVTGTLAGSATIITEPAQKQALYQSSGAVAVDMESAAIAILAQNVHIPFMSIRAIADDVETGIPAYINMGMDMYGNINPARMLGLLLTHPASWFRLMRLGHQFSAAEATLSLVSERIGIDGLLPPALSD